MSKPPKGTPFHWLESLDSEREARPPHLNLREEGQQSARLGTQFPLSPWKPVTPSNRRRDPHSVEDPRKYPSRAISDRTVQERSRSHPPLKWSHPPQARTRPATNSHQPSTTSHKHGPATHTRAGGRAAAVKVCHFWAKSSNAQLGGTLIRINSF